MRVLLTEVKSGHISPNPSKETSIGLSEHSLVTLNQFLFLNSMMVPKKFLNYLLIPQENQVFWAPSRVSLHSKHITRI